MKRKKLLNSKEYWITGIQLNLFNKIEDYMKRNRLKRNQLSEKLGVTKGYVTQILNGDFDHKISKMVELSLACDLIPLFYFVDKNEYLENDSKDKSYEIFPFQRNTSISLEFSKNDSSLPLIENDTFKTPGDQKLKSLGKSSFLEYTMISNC